VKIERPRWKQWSDHSKRPFLLAQILAEKPQMPERRYADEDPESSYIKAKNAALRLLSYRSRSEKEVQRRLQGRFTQDAVDRTLSDLRRQGLLDDVAFAKQWREKRERFRPRGPAVIRQELQKLGVDREVIREALSGFDSSANAYQAGSKYASKLSVDNAGDFRRKLGGFLHRRGFEGDVLGQTVERIWRELLDPLDGSVDGDGQYD
jgi:regulatory protein